MQEKLKRPPGLSDEKWRALYNKRWCEANREKKRAYSKKWRDKNKKHAAALRRAWKVQNASKIQAYRIKYRQLHPEEHRVWARAQYAKEPKKYRLRQRLAKYGLTRVQYEEMQTAQGHKCLICQTTTDNLHLDHNHATGKVRGLLCNLCNLGLGLFKDDKIRLAQAIAYLDAAG